MKTISITLLFLSIISCNPEVNKRGCTLTPSNLKCENIKSPVGIDIPVPCLSWQLISEVRKSKQIAYQIIVTDNLKKINKKTGNFWNSGKIISSESMNIRYKGKELSSGHKFYWRVRVWDESGNVSEWSQPAAWSMGLLNAGGWKADWIGQHEDMAPDTALTGPAPYFRKEFNLNGNIKSAVAYISGLGFYELYMNGKKVGDQVLAPAQTNYDRRELNNLIYDYDDQSMQRVLYNTFEITDLLKNGDNSIGIILGNGWFNQRDRSVEGCMWYSTPRLIFQMEITYTNGQKTLITSDKSWKVTTGPLLHDGIFTGEVYDARLEMEKWNLPGYDDSHWDNVQLVRKPDGKLVSQLAPHDKINRSFRPVSVKRSGNSSFICDAGEMVSGWINLKVSGDRGDTIKIKYTEELGKDYGQTDIYIIKGEETENYEPRFTWHSFRTFEISGIKNQVTADDILIKVVNTDVERAGEFSCSNQLFNKIYDNYIRTQEGNFHGSISSDCPHRERLGYTGDGQVIVEASIFSFDMTQFYQKWFNDMDDARNKKTGYVPHTAPFGGGGGGPAWGSAYVIMPWYYYIYYNDKQILEQHYNGMKQWVNYLGTRTDSLGIVVREEPNGWCLGDWALPAKIELPESLVNTCYYYYVTAIMAKVALTLGMNDDKLFFEKLAEKIRNDFNRHFFNPVTFNYWEGKQGANVFPLAFGMVPENYREKVFGSMINNIKTNNYHFDTGILATPLLLSVLTANGKADVAYKLMNQRDFPGFGYIESNNTTTLWENWSGKSSHSHPMYGSVTGWFFKHLAGIQFTEGSTEETHFTLKPEFCVDLKFVKAKYNSLYGEIYSGWEKNNGEIIYNINIPANTSATLYLPGNNIDNITEKGIQISKNDDILSVEIINNLTVIKIGSGSYRFVIKNLIINEK